jgi:hypothetical protein
MATLHKVAAIIAALLLTHCAQKAPAPRRLNTSNAAQLSRAEILSTQYVGRRVSEIQLEFGFPARHFEMGPGEMAYQWDKISVAGASMRRLSAVVTTDKSTAPAEWIVKRLQSDGYRC